MAHAHPDPDELNAVIVDAGVRRRLTLIAVGLAVLTVVGMVLLRPTADDRPDLARLGVSSRLYDARVESVETGPCPGTRLEDVVVCDAAVVELLAGPDKGERAELQLTVGPTSPNVGEGDVIVVAQAGGPGTEYQFVDRQRRPALLGLAVLFALAVVVLGRLRGLAALGGLVASVAVLLWFTLPAIIDGRSPLWVAVVTASAVAFFALYLAHGFNPMTTVALLGTLASLALTALLAFLFVALAHFSGFATEEARFLEVAGGSIDMEGLILAGVVIGALGAIDDMTVTQASAVWELRLAQPGLGFGALYAAGLRIGRDHVASTVNTLVLAYVGASLPLMLLFVLSEQSLGSVANGESVAVEVVRTLVGSIGLVSSVPLTTWLAARVAPARPSPASGPSPP